MNGLQIRLFGTVSIAHNHGVTSGTNPSRTTQALLAHLILEPRRIYPREVLAGMLWGDSSEEKARSSLRTTLWRLRRILEPDGVPRGTYLITNSLGEIGFNWESDYWLDVQAFEQKARQVLANPVPEMCPAQVQELEHNLQLYTGELLYGFYDDCFLRQRERLRSIYMQSLMWLLQVHRDQGTYQRAVEYGKKILSEDPLLEDVHREVMRIYLQNGHRTLALRQYEMCRDILRAELGIPPMEETQQLYARMLETRGREPSRPLLEEEATSIQQALHQLSQTIRGLDAIREDLHRRLLVLQKSIESAGWPHHKQHR